MNIPVTKEVRIFNYLLENVDRVTGYAVDQFDIEAVYIYLARDRRLDLANLLLDAAQAAGHCPQIPVDKTGKS